MAKGRGRGTTQLLWCGPVGGRRGIVFALLAVSLVGLIAAVAATFDVARLAATKQQMQNACDMAATAGTSAVNLADEEVWDTAARYYAANVYGTGNTAPTPQRRRPLTDPSFPGQVTGAEYEIGDHLIEVRHPFRDAATDQERLDPEKIVYVRASRVTTLPLAAIVGVRQANVVARAAADRHDLMSKAFIFAAAAGPDDVGINASTNGVTILGAVHSNSKVDITGFGTTVTDWVDYRYDYRVKGQGSTFEMGFRVGNVQPLPLKFTPSDFEPYDYVVQGNLTFNKVIPSGVYYIDGDLSITGDDVPQGPVTFVVTGRIKVSGSGHGMEAARNGMLIYSLSTNKQAIDISAQGGQWSGYIFAPNGGISFSASGIDTYVGGIVGQTISFSAKDFTASGTVEYISSSYSRLFR